MVKVHTLQKLLAITALLSVITSPAYAEDRNERCEDAGEAYQRMESAIIPLQALLWDELDRARDSKDLAAVGKILTLINKSRKIRKDYGKDYKKLTDSLRCAEFD